MAIISSHNCHGLNTAKLAYVNKLFAESDFVFLQEHRLYNDDLPSLAKIDSSQLYHSCSSMCDTKLASGRPFGGVAILWHSRLNKMIKVYKQFSTLLCRVCTVAIVICCSRLSLFSYLQSVYCTQSRTAWSILLIAKKHLLIL